MRILFVTSTRIGDAVLSSGLLDHLIATYPGARITIACGAEAAPLFEAVPGLERLIPMVKRPFSLHWLALWSHAVAALWDLVVDLRGSALAWAVPARNRRVLPPGEKAEHRVERLARLFDLAEPPSPRVWLAPRHEQAAAQLIPDGGPVLALGPTANWAPKTWPAENFAELVALLTGADGILPGARVAVFGAAGERANADKLIREIPAPRCIDLIGRIDLPTVAACLRRSALYIGNDSGLMHLAAAAGCPTLGLFGPSPTVHYAPWGTHTAVAETEIPYAELVGAPDFDHLAKDNLMYSLSVDKVARAAEALWRRSPRRAA